MTRGQFNVDDTREALDLIVEPGAVFEVRALDAKLSGNHRRGTVSGYFNNAAACVSELAKITEAKGVYVTLNPVNPALLARCANRLDYAERSATTSDQHVLRRRWLLIDTDADRPSGIGATDSEKEAAKERTRAIFRYLKERGWPEPVVADSGNGFHLLYRVDLPAADDGLVGKLLAALSAQFNDDGVKIDASVHNPARITRLYGTQAAKGDDTQDRPHRLSSIVKAPATLEPVTAEQLRALLSELDSAKPQPGQTSPPRDGTFDVEDFFRRHGIESVDKTRLPDARTMWLLKRCPFNPDHVETSVAVFQWPNGMLGFECKHESCRGKHWKDFREHFEPGHRYKSGSKSIEEGNDDEQTEFTSLSSSGTVDYPAPPDEAAFHGLAGDIVRRIEPQTEADPVALLSQLLVGFGNIIGRTAYMVADGARHYLNFFIVLIGRTGKGRKGTAWSRVRNFFVHVDKAWCENVTPGLSSGEGLIWAVRDPIIEEKPIKDKGRHTGEYETVVTDHGVTDKRLLVTEGEFANVLKVMTREGNTLSPLIRSAWETGKLRTLVKNSPARATGAHISIIGHITRQEQRRLLTETESANGFANRFCFMAVDRSKCLSEGGAAVGISDLVVRLQNAIEFAKNCGELKRDDAARELWAKVYPALSEGKPGLLGAITARAEAQVLRLSAIYALLDCSNVIRVEHLKAALALWNYCERSATWIFETGTGNKNADKILAALKAAGQKGLTRLQITNEVFNRHATKFEIDEALRLLYSLKLAVRKLERTATRSAERWIYKAQQGEVCEESNPGDGETGDTSHSSHPPLSKNASSAESDKEVETLVGDELGVGRL